MSFLFLYLYFYFRFSCHFSLPLLNPIFISLLILQSLFLFQFFIFYVCLCCIIIVGWNSVVSIICYGLDGPRMEFWWWRDFPHPSRQPWRPTSLLYNGYWVSFPGEEWPGRGVDHPPPSSTEGKERVELYTYSPSGSSWPVLG